VSRGRTTLLLVLGAGVLVALFFLLRPDDEEAEPAPTTQPPATGEITTAREEEEPEPEPEPELPTLRVTVLEGRPEGGIQRLAVARGDRLRIVVRADVSDHVHVHGYDLMRNVGPGRPAQLAFRATIPGRFEIELEDRHLLIAELEVTP
jgi:hypothetical protein